MYPLHRPPTLGLGRLHAALCAWSSTAQRCVLDAAVMASLNSVLFPLQMGGTVFDMEEAELCYAPQVRAMYCYNRCSSAAVVRAVCIPFGSLQ